MEKIVIGGGCFWCTEGVMSGLKGVSKVIPGYSGGHVENPTYEQVCKKNTGHAEVVEVTYNPKIINLKTILEIFFTSHDPTQIDRQGNDIGHHYRSIIFYNNEGERELVNLVIDNLKDVFEDKIVTEVVSAEKFYTLSLIHI